MRVDIGLLIDFGTADQHKYTRGGWKTGWGSSGREEGITFAPATAQKTHVNVVIPADGEVKEIVIRGRSKVAGQVLTVLVDGTRIGEGKFASSWRTIRIPAKGFDGGRHRIEIVFSKEGAVRADVDWMLFARETVITDAAVLPHALALRIGETVLRALPAPTSRSYSFYMQPPPSANLVFEYGSDKGVTFRVMAEVDGDIAKELWRATAKNQWQEGVVDLSEFSGKAMRLSLVTEGDDGLTGWGEPEIMVDTVPTPVMSEGKKPKNVILLMMGTSRADNFLAFDANTRVKTPAFDKLAAASLVFKNAYNQANSAKPSVSTTLSGTYPATHHTMGDSEERSVFPTDLELISEHLQHQGFQTAGFVANGCISKKYGFEKGWDSFENYLQISEPAEAARVYGESLAWLKEHKNDKYFLYIHTIDAHTPYRHRGEATSRYQAKDFEPAFPRTISGDELARANKRQWTPSSFSEGFLKAMYYGEVSYHDTEMGKFVDELATMGVLDNTVVIVTNDHGEEHGEHDTFGHGDSLFEETLRAPLIIHYPRLIKPTTLTSEVVENVDVAPTIVEMLGLEPMVNADGLSLMPLMRGEPVQRPFYAMSEAIDARAIRVGGWKMIWAADTAAAAAVFHTELDRGEMKDVAETALIARRMLEVYAGEAQASFDKKQRMQALITKRQFKAGTHKADRDFFHCQ